MIIPCVTKPSCTHGTIISLWLICYIQCGFSISYLSISGIVAHDRCNISHIFTFSFQFQCLMSCCTFHLHNCLLLFLLLILLLLSLILLLLLSLLLLLLLILLLLLLLLVLLLLLSVVLFLILFVNVCIVFYPLIFFFMPQVKDQQSYSLHLILAFFIFVTTIFRLIVFKFYDFVFLL